MSKVLYEASFEFEFSYLIPVIMMVFIAVFPFFMKRYCESQNAKYDYKTVKNFCIGAFIFVVFWSIVVFSSQIHMYHKTVGAYKRGEYQVVEGYVENFVPMPYEGHSDESFEINGVKFAYSDFSIQSGYNNAKSHGGVIQGNGQHLKIGYVCYDESYGNVIVYIEELPK